MNIARLRTNGGLRTVAGAQLRGVRLVPVVLRLAVVATVTESGYLHAKLYVNGYRFIPHIGTMFLLQAAVSFAVATLLLFGGPLILRLAAAGTALGALGGFVLSRTVGFWGFTERGFQPHPDALLSLLSELATVGLLAVWTADLVRRRAPGEPARLAVDAATT
jgi:hypothetical protein